MVVFNYSGAEINAKVVYYGPALGGKTTNLENIYEKMPVGAKGKMVSMKTRTDRTLFFDFLPLELGDIRGYQTRILLYTVPGQVYYNATRKLVLKGADAVVFVADSDPAKLAENVESLQNLEENLNEHGLTLDTIPWVIQYNKRDLPNALPVEALAGKLNLLGVPSFEAVATDGAGVYETFQSIAGVLYNQLSERLRNAQPARAERPQKAVDETAGEAEAAVGAVAPAAGAAETAGGCQEADGTVSDMIDVAFREVEPAAADAADTVPGPAADTPAGRDDAGAGDDFRFASLQEEKIDDEVGRVIDLDDTVRETRSKDPSSEFVLDPFQRSGNRDKAPAAGPAPADGAVCAADPPARPVAPDADEISVTVPVLITPDQMRKSIAVNLQLQIQIVDKEK